MQLNFLLKFAALLAVWYLNGELPCFCFFVFFNGSERLHSPIKHPQLRLQLHTADFGAEKFHQLVAKQEVGTGAKFCQGRLKTIIIISSY